MISPKSQRIGVSGRCRPFTLIELLVVVSIIAILASLLLPALSNARDKSREIECVGRLKQLDVAALLYADDWGGSCVPYNSPYNDNPGPHGPGEDVAVGWRWTVWMDLLYQYTNSVTIFDCPSGVLRQQTPVEFGYGITIWVYVQACPAYECHDNFVQGDLRPLRMFKNPEHKVYLADSGYTQEYYAGRAPVGEHYSPIFQVAAEATSWDGVMPSARHREPPDQAHVPGVGPTGGGSNVAWMDGHVSYMKWHDLVPIIHWQNESKYWKPWL